MNNETKMDYNFVLEIKYEWKIYLCLKKKNTEKY